MTVNELRKALEGVPGDMEVAMFCYGPDAVTRAKVMTVYMSKYDLTRDMFFIGADELLYRMEHIIAPVVMEKPTQR